MADNILYYGDNLDALRQHPKVTPTLLALTILTLHGAAAGQQPALDAAGLYRRTSPSIVSVLTFDRLTQPLAQGSGFFLDDSGTVATNYHVIEGAVTIQIKALGHSDVTAVLGVSATNLPNDLAIVRTALSRTSPLPLGVVRPTVGERVFALGNPLGLEGTISEGIVSGIRQVGNVELYQITSPISPGSSGGPVLNGRGQVIGIATGALRLGQNLNFAVPSASLDQLWKHAGPLQTVPDATRAKRPPTAPTPETPLIRFVDIELNSYGGDEVSMYNGTQYTIKNVRVRTICWKQGIDVPVDSYDGNYVADEPVTGYTAKPLLPGLSRVVMFLCKAGTTRAEFRVLDFDIVK